MRRRTLTSAWIETRNMVSAHNEGASRTLTSAWIETDYGVTVNCAEIVALSRVRGLKLSVTVAPGQKSVSHSHECVD